MLAGGAIVLVAILAILWYLVSPLFIELEVRDEALVLPDEEVTVTAPQPGTTGPQPTPMQQTPLYEGTFERIDYNVEGSFAIYETENKHLLRIENLDITNGPDLYFVFANEKNSAVRNFTIIERLTEKGTFNVEIPEDINPADYKYLHIHCVRFRHTFAGGEIRAAS